MTAEAIIQEHPLVSGALIVGQGRTQAALWLELKAPDTNTWFVVDAIMPVLEQGNSCLPGQGWISRSMILIAPADNPFHRTGKSTIVRKLTEKDFATEIEILYAEGDGPTKVKPPSWHTFEEEALKRLLQAVVSQCCPNIEILQQDDLFRRGLDSLKTIEVVQAIRASLRHRIQPADVSKLSVRMVYENPSIERLAQAISKFLSRDGLATSERLASQEKSDRIAAMKAMVAQCTQQLNQPHNVLEGHTERTDLQIALTGSTGSLRISSPPHVHGESKNKEDLVFRSFGRCPREAPQEPNYIQTGRQPSSIP